MSEKHIFSFIGEQTVANICCTDEQNLPYCFSCFYALDEQKHILYFKTNDETRHNRLMKENNRVAGTILPDKLNRLAIKGIQLEGHALLPHSEEMKDASSVYHRKYPFALAMPGDVWGIKIRHIKMTDNTLSFGKKIEWSAD